MRIAGLVMITEYNKVERVNIASGENERQRCAGDFIVEARDV